MENRKNCFTNVPLKKKTIVDVSVLEHPQSLFIYFCAVCKLIKFMLYHYYH